MKVPHWVLLLAAQKVESMALKMVDHWVVSSAVLKVDQKGDVKAAHSVAQKVVRLGQSKDGW